MVFEDEPTVQASTSNYAVTPVVRSILKKYDLKGCFGGTADTWIVFWWVGEENKCCREIGSGRSMLLCTTQLMSFVLKKKL